MTDNIEQALISSRRFSKLATPIVVVSFLSGAVFAVILYVWVAS